MMLQQLTAWLQKPLSAIVVLLIYALCGFGIYWPSIGNGFNSDDFVWLDLLGKAPGPFLNFNDRFFLPFTHTIQYLLLFFSKENAIIIHIFQLLIHIFNGFLLYKAVLIWRNRLSLRPPLNYRPVAFLSGLTFCLNPYNTEAVNWFAAISYPLSTLFLLFAIITAAKAYSSQNTRNIILSSMLYLFSMLCKEISIPLILILLLAIVMRYISFKPIGKMLLLGYCLALVAYFGLRYLALENFIGGYGSNVHVLLSIEALLTAMAAYFAKFFLFYRYLFAESLLSDELRVVVLLSLGIVILLSLILFLLKHRRNAIVKLRTPFFLLVVFAICCLPVLSLEITSLGSPQSDRYGYLPGLAFSIFLGTYLSLIAKPINFIMTLGIVLLFCMSSIETNLIYRSNDRLIKTITKDFKMIHKKGKPVLMLNIPDNYEGVYTFRHGFFDAMQRNCPEEKLEIEIIAWQTIEENSCIAIEPIENAIKVKSLQADLQSINTNCAKGRVIIQDKLSQFTFFPFPKENLQILYFNHGHLHVLNPTL